jgi:hypothetical protein
VRGIIRISGTRDEPRHPAGGLVKDFLLYTARLSDEEVASIAAVSPSTVRRWRIAGVRRLKAGTSARMAQHVRACATSGDFALFPK